MVIKLSSPATRGFWEIPILFEDEHLLAVDKPAGLLVSPDRNDPKRPSLMALLHHDIQRGAPWAKERVLAYLMNTHRLDFETSGALLLAKNKTAFKVLASLFGSEQPNAFYTALVRGDAVAEKMEFQVEAPLAPNALQMGTMRVDSRKGKRARTNFIIRESFKGYHLVECCPLTHRQHQISVHLKHAGFKLVGDRIYGGQPLLLSRLKSGYRLKPGRTERPLVARIALHLGLLKFPHPVTGAKTEITSPLPRDLAVAVKYLRRYASLNSPTDEGGEIELENPA